MQSPSDVVMFLGARYNSREKGTGFIGVFWSADVTCGCFQTRHETQRGGNQKILVSGGSGRGADCGTLGGTVRRPSSYPVRTVKHWQQELRFGREDLDDLLRTGKPPGEEVDGANLEAFTNEPFHFVRPFAQDLKIPKSTISDHWAEQLELRPLRVRLVPFKLSPKVTVIRVRIARKLLGSLQQSRTTHFTLLVTGDESPFYLDNHRINQWTLSSDEVGAKRPRKIWTAKSCYQLFGTHITFMSST
jgi:hypothetical protein